MFTLTVQLLEKKRTYPGTASSACTSSTSPGCPLAHLMNIYIDSTIARKEKKEHIREQHHLHARAGFSVIENR